MLNTARFQLAHHPKPQEVAAARLPRLARSYSMPRVPQQARRESDGSPAVTRGRSPLPSPLTPWEPPASPVESPSSEKHLLKSPSSPPAVALPPLQPDVSRAPAPPMPMPMPMSFTAQDLVTSGLQTGPVTRRLYRLLGLPTHQATAERINQLHQNMGPRIDRLLEEKLGWAPSLKGLEIEFVRRQDVRPYLGAGTRFWSVQGLIKRLLSYFTTHVYTPLMPSQSMDAEATLKSRGRLMMVLPNAWWMSQAQLEYQLAQALTLVSVHQNVPSTFNHLTFMGSSDLFGEPRNGLGGVMHGLSEVVAKSLVPEATRAQFWLRPTTWFNSRTRTQRVGEALMRWAIPDMLEPQRIGRKHVHNITHVFSHDPALIDRTLRFPCASIGLTATPDPNGTPLDFDHEAAQGRYAYDQAERDVMKWERFNPAKGAIRYFQPQSQLRAASTL